MDFCSTWNRESNSLWRMSKTFRPWDVEQRVLLSVHELVPAGHLAHFVRDTVREDLDLSRIMETYTEERGYPPYHPTMMVALLLYAYSRGVYSSRKIAQACEERVDFIAVTAMNRPDHRTIARFRRRHLKALGDLFVQVLKLCRTAGLVRLGHVALDGTKMQANASVHKAMSYGRMREAEKKLSAEVSAWLAHAEATDAAEDREHGTEKRGDEMPDWVANKAARLDRIRAAKAALEAEAKQPPPQDDDRPGPSSGMMKSGKTERGADGGPPDRAQRNFTDPDSRIQPTRGGCAGRDPASLSHRSDRHAGLGEQRSVSRAHLVETSGPGIARGRAGLHVRRIGCRSRPQGTRAAHRQGAAGGAGLAGGRRSCRAMRAAIGRFCNHNRICVRGGAAGSNAGIVDRTARFINQGTRAARSLYGWNRSYAARGALGRGIDPRQIHRDRDSTQC